MSRPKPTVIFESQDDNNSAIQVCEADAVYAVTYQNKPIMLRKIMNVYQNYPGPKYNKSSFTSPGHAFNLAERLNQMFNTTEFTVMIMQPGRVLNEKR